jgi:outer membrane protein assembly factor BamE (lipoprotein component of BamABCDE complex)
MPLKKIYIIVLAALLSGCEPTIANRGNIIDPEKLSEIKAGASTREEVAANLGTPTIVSTFDDKIWYYAGRQTEQYSFLDPEIMKQKVIEVKFDDQGVVTTIDNLDLSKEKDIDPVDRETPTYGNDDTFIKQLLGNLAHPHPGDEAKKEGQ